MALTFDGSPGHHDYYLDDVRVPSVTQILRDQTLVNFDGVPSFILEKARARGTAVHQLIHYYNEHDLDWSSIDPAYLPYVEAWVACVAQRRIQPLLCERRIASRRYRVAGTLDLLAEIDGDGWLLDFATGDPEDAAKDFQTGAYVQLALEWQRDDDALADVLARFPRWRRASVRLMKTGTFRLTEYTDARDYARFSTLAAAWHIRNERGVIVQPDDLAA